MADFDLWNLELALWALEEYRDTIERQIARIGEDDWKRTELNLALSGAAGNETEVGLAVQDHAWLAESILPRLLRGGYVLVLWGAFESGVIEAAACLCKKQHKELRLGDIRGGDLLERASKYWHQVLDTSFLAKDDDGSALSNLLAVRNAFAHANGRISAVPPRQQAALRQLVDRDLGVQDDHGHVSLSEGFVRRSYGAVSATLTHLIQLARTME